MGITKTLRKKEPGFGKETTLIHGEYGTGKTLLSAQFNKPYFFMFENNDSYKDKIYHDNITSWDQFEELAKDFIENDHEFKTVVLDGLFNLYDMAKIHFIDTYNANLTGTQTAISSLTDIPYGKAHSAVDDMIKRVVNPLANDPRFLLIMISHTEEAEIKMLSGDAYHKLSPQLPKRARNYFCTLAQNIYYYHYVKSERYLMITGDESVQAKNRGNGNFCTKTGENVVNIPMPESPEKAYKYLVAAYNNKLSNSYKNINK